MFKTWRKLYGKTIIKNRFFQSSIVKGNKPLKEPRAHDKVRIWLMRLNNSVEKFDIRSNMRLSVNIQTNPGYLLNRLCMHVMSMQILQYFCVILSNR